MDTLFTEIVDDFSGTSTEVIPWEEWSTISNLGSILLLMKYAGGEGGGRVKELLLSMRTTEDMLGLAVASS